MSTRKLFALLWVFVVVMLGIAVRDNGWWPTIKGLAWFWGAWFGTVAVLRINARVQEWRESRQVKP